VRVVDVYPYVSGFVGSLVKLLSFAVVLSAAYIWLTFVLVQFPYTEPWGESLGSFLGNLAGEFGIGILEAVPGFFTVLLIFILTRVVTRGVSSFFESVERGRIELAWLGADTARASRRISVVLIWIFAITVAYPYIPGSQSEAFKGVSVFAGLMVSLGGAGFINQIMSGLVVVYARTFRIGDYVRVGDKEGVVIDIGALTTKIKTRALEEITVPNAVLVGTTVTNYTKLTGKDGAVVSTTVTIGYDTPWRQVHALLQLAAERVQGLRRMPRPTVLQRALSDFYVEYQMLAHLVRPDERISVLSDLHANIQDVFNEFEVQIMSPHFETQPREKVIVKKDGWLAAPAKEGEPTDVAPR
jgi:small-conductance mechanosensitive channel